jgi:hypothetical protein
MHADQFKLLGRFVRSHRERIAPDVLTGRRRTPGLRREELAARAGIGVTWLTWIEQGRDVAISPATLARLAVALGLTGAERTYLFDLGGRGDPDRPPARLETAAPASVAAAVAAVCHPAYGLDARWNVSCWNAAAAHLFSGWLQEGRPANLLHFILTDPRARALVPAWQERACRLIAEFRADVARHPANSLVQGLVEELTASSDLFGREWQAQAVLAREGGIRHFTHPSDGPLSFMQHTLHPADRQDHKVVLLVPHDAVDIQPPR